jgi:hypothetical protein
MAFEDYHASRTTLDRLETTFKNGYLHVLKLIAENNNFFNGDITGEELFNEFVVNPIQEIKDLEKKKNKQWGEDEDNNEGNKGDNRGNNRGDNRGNNRGDNRGDINGENSDLQISKKYKKNMNKCHAIIPLKKELRQCQSNQLPDDDFCFHHSKLDVLPHGRITF